MKGDWRMTKEYFEKLRKAYERMHRVLHPQTRIDEDWANIDAGKREG